MTSKNILLYPKEAMELLGVKETKFRAFRTMPDFPKGKTNEYSKRPMYLREELEAWAKSLSS